MTAVAIPGARVLETLKALQEYGKKQCEGLVLWLGVVEGATATVSDVIVPPQQSVSSEDGVGYFVDTETLFVLNRLLDKYQLRLIAQVHSHPGEAYHSPTDDRYAIVTAEGGFSLVVPDFGQAPADPAAWAVYRLSGRGWHELSEEEAQSVFRCT